MSLRGALGIDLGAGTIRIVRPQGGRIREEANLAALRQGRVFAVGNDALAMAGRLPADITLVSPMQNGRLHDVLLMETILHAALAKSGRSLMGAPAVLFSVPADMTEMERRAYAALAKRGRLRRAEVYLAERPICDALALGLSILHTGGSMLVNIGAQCTEVSVLADRRCILRQQIPLGGASCTQAVAEGVRRVNHFSISLSAAAEVKEQLADLGAQASGSRLVRGIDLDTGLPCTSLVTAGSVSKSTAEVMLRVAAQVSRVLQRTPPQIRASILEEGMYVTGGAGRIPHLQAFFSRAVGCPVHVCTDGALCTARGLSDIITHTELQHWAYAPGKRAHA